MKKMEISRHSRALAVNHQSRKRYSDPVESGPLLSRAGKGSFPPPLLL